MATFEKGKGHFWSVKIRKRTLLFSLKKRVTSVGKRTVLFKKGPFCLTFFLYSPNCLSKDTSVHPSQKIPNYFYKCQTEQGVNIHDVSLICSFSLVSVVSDYLGYTFEQRNQILLLRKINHRQSVFQSRKTKTLLISTR